MEERSKELLSVSPAGWGALWRPTLRALTLATFLLLCIPNAHGSLSGDWPIGAVFNPKPLSAGHADINVDSQTLAEINKAGGDVSVACRIPARGGSPYNCKLLTTTNRALAGFLIAVLATGDLAFAPMQLNGVPISGTHIFSLHATAGRANTPSCLLAQIEAESCR